MIEFTLNLNLSLNPDHVFLMKLSKEGLRIPLSDITTPPKPPNDPPKNRPVQ